jgi:hypothetical protein
MVESKEEFFFAQIYVDQSLVLTGMDLKKKLIHKTNIVLGFVCRVKNI